MKKIICILLGFIFAFSLASCGNNTANTNSGDASNLSGEASDTAEKVLVVYYSATGNTEAVAETIADTLTADTFEIIPAEEYTSDDLNWTDDSSRVSIEHNDESKRDVPLAEITPDNWEQYDTVYIGYPIWWGIAAWPVDGFVKGNDFTGKKVIPFCTSSSSDIGKSGEILADMAGTGNWAEGKRFSPDVSEEEIITWVKSHMEN